MHLNLKEFRAATGSSNAVLLPYAIAHCDANATHGGHTWIAKSAAAWCEETGLTSRQYENAARRLRERHLIVTEQHLFGGDHKKAITHLRPTHLGQALVSKAIAA